MCWLAFFELLLASVNLLFHVLVLLTGLVFVDFKKFVSVFDGFLYLG